MFSMCIPTHGGGEGGRSGQLAIERIPIRMCPGRKLGAARLLVIKETSPEKGSVDEGEPCRKHFHTEHLLCARNRIISNKRPY